MPRVTLYLPNDHPFANAESPQDEIRRCIEFTQKFGDWAQSVDRRLAAINDRLVEIVEMPLIAGDLIREQGKSSITSQDEVLEILDLIELDVSGQKG